MKPTRLSASDFAARMGPCSRPSICREGAERLEEIVHPLLGAMSWETPVPTYACREGSGALSVVAGGHELWGRAEARAVTGPARGPLPMMAPTGFEPVFTVRHALPYLRQPTAMLSQQRNAGHLNSGRIFNMRSSDTPEEPSVHWNFRPRDEIRRRACQEGSNACEILWRAHPARCGTGQCSGVERGVAL